MNVSLTPLPALPPLDGPAPEPAPLALGGKAKKRSKAVMKRPMCLVRPMETEKEIENGRDVAGDGGNDEADHQTDNDVIEKGADDDDDDDDDDETENENENVTEQRTFKRPAAAKAAAGQAHQHPKTNVHNKQCMLPMDPTSLQEMSYGPFIFKVIIFNSQSSDKISEYVGVPYA